MVIFLIALSLSLDAFSLAIIYGMFNLSNKEEIILSIIVGIYHFIMPIIGSYIGNIILNLVPIKLNILVSVVFVLIGIEMIVDTFKDEQHKVINGILEMLVFGLAVSIDSFGTGLGLKYITDHIILSSITFSLVSSILTYIGLKFGQKIGIKIGKTANIIGGMILTILGIIYLFK